jgi:hypothetical protein
MKIITKKHDEIGEEFHQLYSELNRQISETLDGHNHECAYNAVIHVFCSIMSYAYEDTTDKEPQEYCDGICFVVTEQILRNINLMAKDE